MESEDYIEDESDESLDCGPVGPPVVERVVVHRTIDKNKTRSIVSERIAVNDRGKEDFVEREIAIPFEEKAKDDYSQDRSFGAIRSRKEGEAYDLYLSMKGKSSYEAENIQRLEIQQQGHTKQMELAKTIRELTTPEGTDEELEALMIADEVEDIDTDQDFHELADAIEASVASGRPVSEAELSEMCERVINQTAKPPTESEACLSRLLEEEELERTRTMHSDEIQETLELLEAKRYTKTLEQLGDSKLQLEEKYLKDIEAVQEQIPQPEEQEKYLQLLTEKFDNKLDQLENVRATLKKPRILYEPRYEDETSSCDEEESAAEEDDDACPIPDEEIQCAPPPPVCPQEPQCPQQGPPRQVQVCPRPPPPTGGQECVPQAPVCVPQAPVCVPQAPVCVPQAPVCGYQPRPSAPPQCPIQTNVCPAPNSFRQFNPQTASTPTGKDQCARPRLSSGSDAPNRRDMPGPSWWDPLNNPNNPDVCDQAQQDASVWEEYRPELFEGCPAQTPEHEASVWEEYRPELYCSMPDQPQPQEQGVCEVPDYRNIPGPSRWDPAQPFEAEVPKDYRNKPEIFLGGPAEPEVWEEYRPELWISDRAEPQPQPEEQQVWVPIRPEEWNLAVAQQQEVCPAPAQVSRQQAVKPKTLGQIGRQHAVDCPKPAPAQTGRQQVCPRPARPATATAGRQQVCPRPARPATATAGRQQVCPAPAQVSRQQTAPVCPAPAQTGRQQVCPRPVRPATATGGRQQVCPRPARPATATAGRQQVCPAPGKVSRQQTAPVCPAPAQTGRQQVCPRPARPATATGGSQQVCPRPARPATATAGRQQVCPAPAQTGRQQAVKPKTLGQIGRQQAVDCPKPLKPSKSNALLAEIEQMRINAQEFYDAQVAMARENVDSEDELEGELSFLQCELQAKLDHIDNILELRAEARKKFLKDYADAKVKIKDPDMLQERLKFIKEEYDNYIDFIFERRKQGDAIPVQQPKPKKKRPAPAKQTTAPPKKTGQELANIRKAYSERSRANLPPRPPQPKQKRPETKRFDDNQTTAPPKKTAEELANIRKAYSEISRVNLPPRPPPVCRPPPQISEAKVAKAQAERKRRALAPKVEAPKKTVQEIAEERKALKAKYGLQSLPPSALPRARTVPLPRVKSAVQLKHEKKKQLSKAYTMKPHEFPTAPVYKHAKPVVLRPPTTRKPVKEIAKKREALSKAYTMKPHEVPPAPVYKHAKPVVLRPPNTRKPATEIAKQREELRSKYNIKSLPAASKPKPRTGPPPRPTKSVTQMKGERLQALKKQYTVKPSDVPKGPSYRHAKPVSLRPPVPVRTREDVARKRELLKEKYSMKSLPATARPKPRAGPPPRPAKSEVQLKAERLQELKHKYTVKPSDVPKGPAYRHPVPVNLRPPRPAKTREEIAREREQLKAKYSIKSLPREARPRPPARPPARPAQSAAQIKAEQQRALRREYTVKPGDVPRGPGRRDCIGSGGPPRKPSARELKELKLRYSIKGGGSLGAVLAAKRPQAQKIQKPKIPAYDIPNKAKLQFNARMNHLQEVKNAKATIKDPEALQREIEFLNVKFEDELSFIDKMETLTGDLKRKFVREYESIQRDVDSPREKKEMLEFLSVEFDCTMKDYIERSGARKKVKPVWQPSLPKIPDKDNKDSDDEKGKKKGGKPKKWQVAEKDVIKLKKKIEGNIDDIRKKSNNNNKALLKQVMNVPDKPAMPVGEVKRMVKGVKGITARDLKDALGKAKEETYKNKKKMESLPRSVLKRMGKRGDERFVKSAIEKEQTDEVYNAMMLEKKVVRFKDDPKDVAPLMVPSNTPKIQVVGNAIESLSVGVLPNQIPTAAINQLDPVATEEVATTLASKSKAPPPNDIARTKLADKTNKIKVPEGANKNDFLECEVRLESLTVETLFQAKGSALPDWFPGFFTALPGEPTAVLPHSSPSNVLFDAWEKMQPDYTKTTF